MLDILFQPYFLRQVIQVPIDPHAYISAPAGALQYFFMLSLPAPHYRRKKLDPRSLFHVQNIIHHLIHSSLLNFPAAFGTMGNTDPGIEKPEIIIDLCHCPHRGTWVSIRGFLVNGNSRGEPFYFFHIGLLHLPQKLPRIGRQRLHVAPLSFRIYSIEG